MSIFVHPSMRGGCLQMVFISVLEYYNDSEVGNNVCWSNRKRERQVQFVDCVCDTEGDRWALLLNDEAGLITGSGLLP